MSIEKGIYYDLPAKEYHEDPALGSSDIKVMSSSPADFKASRGVKIKETPAMAFGTAIHSACLPGEPFEETYALCDAELGAKSGKTWKEFKSENKGKICLEYKDAKRVLDTIAAFKRNKDIQEIFSQGKAEVSAFATILDQKVKGRFDWLTPDGFIWDIKTTSKPLTNSSLERVIFDWKYHLQAVHYMAVLAENGIAPQGFGWIFVSTSGPSVHVVPRYASQELINEGYFMHKETLEMLKWCQETNEWPSGVEEGIQELSLPSYVKQRNENE